MRGGLAQLRGCPLVVAALLAGCTIPWSCRGGSQATEDGSTSDHGPEGSLTAERASPLSPPAPFEPICSTEGICWHHPLPQGNDLAALWGSGPENIYAVGARGMVLHFDGERWAAIETGTRRDLRAIWGTGADNIYLGGSQILLHWDGSSWSTLEVEAELEAIWGMGPDRVFAIGAEGAVFQYNGFSWSQEESGTEDHLRAIWGSGRRNVYAVGDEGTLLRYDGTSWHAQPTGTHSHLRAIWGSGAQDVFVTGDDGVVLRFDGERWSSLEDRAIPPQPLTAVWGTGPGNIWVAAAGGSVLNFDGARWTVQVARCEPRPCSHLSGIWGSGPRNVFVVGSHGLILQLRGPQWSTLWPPTAAERLTAVWVSPSAKAYTTSERGEVLHFDGVAWSSLLEASGEGEGPTWPGDLGPARSLNDLWGTSDEDLFAVGDSGTALHYDGQRWARLETGSAEDLQAVWGSGPSEVFAVGAKATLLRYDGVDWRTQRADGPTPNRGTLYAVWGSGPGNAFAVGEGGLVLHYDGSGWNGHMTSVETDLHAVWGTGKGLVFAGGHDRARLANRSLLRYDGRFWKSVSLWPETRDGRVPENIDSLWGTSHNDLYAVADGWIFHFDGSRWRELPTPPCQPVNDMDGSSPENLFFVGAARSVLHLGVRPPPAEEARRDGGAGADGGADEDAEGLDARPDAAEATTTQGPSP